MNEHAAFFFTITFSSSKALIRTSTTSLNSQAGFWTLALIALETDFLTNAFGYTVIAFGVGWYLSPETEILGIPFLRVFSKILRK